MVRQTQERVTGNDAFEGFAIDLMAEIAQILSKSGITQYIHRIHLFFRVQFHPQMGRRRRLRVHEQGDRGMERADG